MGQQELGQTMGVDPSVLVTLLNPLEADRLVTRERDPADRRRHLVALTPAGDGHLASAARAQRTTEDAIFAALDDSQREQLRTLLLALRGGRACGVVAPRRYRVAVRRRARSPRGPAMRASSSRVGTSSAPSATALARSHGGRS